MDYTIGYLPHPEGDFNQSSPYTPMAVVHLNGESFISKVNVPAGIVPRVSTNWTNYWQPFAAGTEGSQGATGAQGIQGPAGSGGGGGEGTQGSQGATGAQGTQGPAGGGSGEPAQERKPGLLVVQGNIKSALLMDEKHDDTVTVPIWYDAERKQHVVDVFNLEPAFEAIGFTGAQGARGIQGNNGAQGSQGLQGIQGLDGQYAAQGIQGIQGLQGIGGETTKTVSLTKAEYDAIPVKDPDTIYLITDMTGPQGAQGAQGATGSVASVKETWTFEMENGTTVTKKVYIEA